MPVDLKCPYVGVWDSFSDEGQLLERKLGPEDVLPYLAKGFTMTEIADRLKAPLEVVVHAVAVIPDMMKWRDLIMYGQPLNQDSGSSELLSSRDSGDDEELIDDFPL
jgi:hypothetical protein